MKLVLTNPEPPQYMYEYHCDRAYPTVEKSSITKPNHLEALQQTVSFINKRNVRVEFSFLFFRSLRKHIPADKKYWDRQLRKAKRNSLSIVQIRSYSRILCHRFKRNASKTDLEPSIIQCCGIDFTFNVPSVCDGYTAEAEVYFFGSNDIAFVKVVYIPLLDKTILLDTKYIRQKTSYKKVVLRGWLRHSVLDQITKKIVFDATNHSFELTPL